MRILLVDDEPSIREPLAAYLSGEGFSVTAAAHAEDARTEAGSGSFDLALVDIMMPGEDGLSLARFLIGSLGLPVILLTAKGDELDRVVGLELGADDYVPKPFSPRELVARIRAVLRREARSAAPGDAAASFLFDDLVLDRTARTLSGRDGAEIVLTGGEYRLLEVLAERAGRVVSRDDLLEMTQGRRADAFDRAIDNQVSRLRKKIERDPAAPRLIKTIRGGGYSLAAEVRRR